jgi:leader peptidase (prepilin peptidase)/N-methyltransferase
MQIPWWHNIPLLSFLCLRGQTACCSQKLSFYYPLAETLVAAMFVISYAKFPFAQGWPYSYVIDYVVLGRFLHAVIFSSLLILCSLIDMRLQIIPDVISLPMVITAPLAVCLLPHMPWKDSLYGVLFGGGIIYVIAWSYVLLRGRIGLGGGDFKLMAAIGGWLGYQSVLPTLFVASILGSLYGLVFEILLRRGNLQVKIPFGPFLAIGALAQLFCHQWLKEYLFIG